MSTKQTVIFSFMLVFLAVFIFALGSHIYWSIELAGKKQQVEALTAKAEELAVTLHGTKEHPGLEIQVNDPENGLKKVLEATQKNVADMEGNESSGAKQREAFYDALQPELQAKWSEAGEAWKKLFDAWRENDKNIAAALARLNKDRKDKDEKVAASEQDLSQELRNEEAVRSKAVAERKDMEKDLSQLRAQSEEMSDRVETVTREERAVKKIEKQGEIIHVAMDLKLVTINLGSGDGVRKGLVFDIYSKSHIQLLKEGSIEIVDVRPSSSDGVILPPKQDVLWDPVTGWVAPDSRMKYSVFSASGPDETEVQELVKPRSRAERIADWNVKENGPGVEKPEEEAEKGTSNTPPSQVGAAFSPIVVGDWVHSSEFEPLLPKAVYQKREVGELLSMEKVNIGPLTLYFTDSVAPYQQEFLKRLCERNQCKVAEAMSADVNYVVTTPGTANPEVVRKEVEQYAGKGEDVTPEVKKLRKTLQALEEGQKFGADVLTEDNMESFFAQRHRKIELLRGTAVQPGQHIFYIAGETKLFSVSNLKKYITDHGGVVSNELNDKVEYIVTGSGLDKKFFEDTVKAKGLKVLREDELPRFFGLE
jgi:hypothetical protein